MRTDDNTRITKCKITIDANGENVKNPEIEIYKIGDSSKEKGEYPGFTYMGFGEYISFFDTKTQKDTPISGTGHFWK